MTFLASVSGIPKPEVSRNLPVIYVQVHDYFNAPLIPVAKLGFISMPPIYTAGSLNPSRSV